MIELTHRRPGEDTLSSDLSDDSRLSNSDSTERCSKHTRRSAIASSQKSFRQR